MTSKRALVCAPAMPEFDRESGSRRIYDLIETLRSSGWIVSFIADSASQGDRYMKLLRQRGIATYVKPSDTQRRQIIAHGRFDLALLCFWHVAESYLPEIRELSPETRVLVDSIDLHFVRNARGRLRSGTDGQIQLLDEKFGAEMVRELNVYAAADGVLTVSDKESGLINDLACDMSLALAVPDAEDLPASPLPFPRRKGILFLGNFRHRPNIDAIEYFCGKVLPLIDPDLLRRHPLWIVGNDLNAAVLAAAAGQDNVRPVGWVPSVLPYLHEARVMVIPLRYGAGTKRKLIQALMVGTPTVSTSIGTEGLAITDGEQALVADDPVTFARSVERMLTDPALWQRVADAGRRHVASRHGREQTARKFAEAIDHVLAKQPKKVSAPSAVGGYMQLADRIKKRLARVLPAGAKVLVVSKGDAALLDLDGCHAAHFPQGADGEYAGYYPADSAAAIAHLDELRRKGAQYLVLPATSLWWLEHYADLARHLDLSTRLILKEKEVCLVYDLSEKESPIVAPTAEMTTGFDSAIERFRPAVDASMPHASANGNGKSTPKPRVLVLGIYLSEKPNTAAHVIDAIAESTACQITQRWIGIGNQPTDERVESVTVRTITGNVPKYKLMNELLGGESVADYDYVVMTDDDVVVPNRMIDHLIGMQATLGFAIAQPARTDNSHTDHPIVTQQMGVMARQTRFVEIGPVVSIHRTAFEFVFPFDESNSMGWGFENVWSREVERRGLVMGIIDAVCVDHSLRKPATHYSWNSADRDRSDYLRRHEHNPLDDCFTVLRCIGTDGKAHGQPASDKQRQTLKLSVLIPTFNRARLLELSLRSLVEQTLPREQYEVIVADDGSSDDTEQTCATFAGKLNLRYFRIGNSGISAAKNMAIFASAAPLLLFFDDDDVADRQLLQTHVEHHASHPEATTAVLGYTTWDSSLKVTPVMRYILDVGQYLFAYRNLKDRQVLDYTCFWGGRTSCKRTLLVNHGVFDQKLKFLEDIELGHRLAKFGLRVIFNRKAISYMIRPVTCEAFCQRCQRQGRAQAQFHRRYPEAFVKRYCAVSGAAEKWAQAKDRLEESARRVREIESLMRLRPEAANAESLERELHQLYKWLFEAWRVKGVVEGLGSDDQSMARLSDLIAAPAPSQRLAAQLA